MKKNIRILFSNGKKEEITNIDSRAKCYQLDFKQGIFINPDNKNETAQIIEENKKITNKKLIPEKSAKLLTKI